jgi:hypothetical protein
VVRRAEWQRLRREDPEGARWIKGTRFALRRRPGECRIAIVGASITCGARTRSSTTPG